MRPRTVPRDTRCFRTSQTIRTTNSGAVVARKVALATVVPRIERCQKNRSPAKARPARIEARPKEVRPVPVGALAASTRIQA
jgi:hypothetical protein